MHKHQSKRRGSKSGKFRNWNTELDLSSQKLIESIADSISGNGPEVTYLKSQYLSKYCDESLTPAEQRRHNALVKFFQCEVDNAATNNKLLHIDQDFNILPRVTIRAFLRFCRRLTRDILGPLRDEVVIGSFSGGASTSRSRTVSQPAFKYVGKADSTEEALCVLDVVNRVLPLLRQHTTSFDDLNVVEGSVLFTVPKKTDIDRCACKEPDFNMFLQKGVGKHIRRRLRRNGIDLNDQSINRKLAHEGSVNNTLATLDLSSASDTISYEFVRSILPEDWFAYLDCIRSHIVRVDGMNHRMEMFSSMGNGFTFELESLLFYVLLRATSYFTACPGILSVYGDDIILPSENADLFTFVLKTFGFKTNVDKSFSRGPFRESCGGHYHNGEDITPFYLKRKATRLTDLIRVTNQLRQWALTVDSRQYEIPKLYSIWSELKSHVPEDLWGGFDYSVDTQLVSPDAPRNKLVRLSEEKKVPQLGAYIHWQNNNWNRSVCPDEPGHEPSTTFIKCRKKSATPSVFGGQQLFFQELL